VIYALVIFVLAVTVIAMSWALSQQRRALNRTEYELLRANQQIEVLKRIQIPPGPTNVEPLKCSRFVLKGCKIIDSKTEQVLFIPEQDDGHFDA
jgi:hypothetical protein